MTATLEDVAETSPNTSLEFLNVTVEVFVPASAPFPLTFNVPATTVFPATDHISPEKNISGFSCKQERQKEDQQQHAGDDRLFARDESQHQNGKK